MVCSSVSLPRTAPGGAGAWRSVCTSRATRSARNIAAKADPSDAVADGPSSSTSVLEVESPSPRKTVSNRRRAAQTPEQSDMVRMLKARARTERNFKLLQAETTGPKGIDRVAAFVVALSLTTLAWYGEDLINQLGQLTSLPVQEIDWAIYFLIAFNAISLVIPGGGPGAE